MRLRTYLSLLGCLILASCVMPFASHDLGSIYNRSAQVDDLERNPVILIPGILGSRLREGEGGRIAWGAFESGAVDVRKPEGLRSLALPMREGAQLSMLRDELIADQVLDRVRVELFRLPVESRAYVRLLSAIGVGGYRDASLAGNVDYGNRHFTCFQFPYDWRRDVAENAVALADFIAEKRRYVENEMRRRYGYTKPVRFDLVAHSMGGLVVRHFLYFGRENPPAQGVPWAGADGIDRVVLIAPPNAGSLDALSRLVDGADYSWVLPHFESGLLGTFPSIYQLLPRLRHHALLDGEQAVDPLDVALWRRHRWGLLDPRQAKVLETLLPEVADPARRQAIADDHLVKSLSRAREVQEALDRDAPVPAGLSVHLIAGDARPTATRYQINGDGRLVASIHGAGDGLVSRASALLDERQDEGWTVRLRSPIHWQGVVFLPGDHLGLIESPAFVDNLLFGLLEKPAL